MTNQEFEELHQKEHADLLAKVSELNDRAEKLEADVKARDIFVENLEIYNQELISKLQSKCPDEELIKGYINKIVEVAELKKEIKDTTEIYEKERAYLRELANKKGDEAERYAKLIHDKNEDSRKQVAKVSEQEKEIAAWKNVSERRAIEPQQLKKELSEQSQRIEALTKENERLKERIDTDWYVLELRNDANRLLQERKDLVEALKEIHNLLDDGLEGSAQSKLESLLSKLEVPNQS